MSAPLLLLFAVACSSRPEPQSARPGVPANSEVATALVIEQFLRAANSNDLDSMARLFGTRQGPVAQRMSKEDADRWLFTIANVLHHDSYSIKAREIVPGRREEATLVVVTMKVGTREVDVPWTLVFAESKTWLIEKIGLEALTGR
jgi:hypothetical protein